MPNENPPRGTAAKRTTTSRTPRATPNRAVPVSEEPVSTAQATVATARNAVGVETNPGNASIDLDAVRRRAYELYEQRGRLDGYHEQDWYSAEQELRGRKQSRSDNGGSADTKRSA